MRNQLFDNPNVDLVEALNRPTMTHLASTDWEAYKERVIVAVRYHELAGAVSLPLPSEGSQPREGSIMNRLVALANANQGPLQSGRQGTGARDWVANEQEQNDPAKHGHRVRGVVAVANNTPANNVAGKETKAKKKQAKPGGPSDSDSDGASSHSEGEVSVATTSANYGSGTKISEEIYKEFAAYMRANKTVKEVYQLHTMCLHAWKSLVFTPLADSESRVLINLSPKSIKKNNIKEELLSTAASAISIGHYDNQLKWGERLIGKGLKSEMCDDPALYAFCLVTFATGAASRRRNRGSVASETATVAERTARAAILKDTAEDCLETLLVEAKKKTTATNNNNHQRHNNNNNDNNNNDNNNHRDNYAPARAERGGSRSEANHTHVKRDRSSSKSYHAWLFYAFHCVCRGIGGD